MLLMLFTINDVSTTINDVSTTINDVSTTINDVSTTTKAIILMLSMYLFLEKNFYYP